MFSVNLGEVRRKLGSTVLPSQKVYLINLKTGTTLVCNTLTTGTQISDHRTSMFNAAQFPETQF
jgi:hypothetical protein